MDDEEDELEEPLPQPPEKSFVLKLQDHTLVGIINSDGCAEWDWRYISAALDMKRSKDHVYLRANHQEFQSEFREAQIPFDQFHYRAAKGGPIGHTMESRALMLMMCLVPLRKQASKPVKTTAISLLNLLISSMVAMGCDGWSFLATVFGTDCQYHSKAISFCNGVTGDLVDLFEYHSSALALWHGFRVCSAVAHATLMDILVFLMYAKAHQQARESKGIWRDMSFLWPAILFMCGEALENCAKVLAARDPEPAPLLKTKKGGNRKVPFGNKLILLKKVRKNKSHRKLVMSSHNDIVPSQSTLVAHEPLVECSEYLKLLDKTFSHCHHYQVSWDPSTYAGDEVLVATIYSHEVGVVGYLPIQFLLHVKSSELDEEIRVLAGKKALTRVAGYCELRALSHALCAVSKSLADFQLPKDLHWKARVQSGYIQLFHFLKTLHRTLSKY